jgi:hypothetical protein
VEIHFPGKQRVDHKFLTKVRSTRPGPYSLKIGVAKLKSSQPIFPQENILKPPARYHRRSESQLDLLPLSRMIFSLLRLFSQLFRR